MGDFFTTAAVLALVTLAYIALFLGPVVGSAMIAEYRRKNVEQQQAIQPHSIEIEVQDGGGYSVVEQLEQLEQTTQPRKSILSFTRIGLVFGVVGNGILVAKALPYLFVPVGSVLYADRDYNHLYMWVVTASIFIGVPLAIWDAVRFSGRRRNGLTTTLSIALCLVTLFTPAWLQKSIGNARQFNTHCDVCDGPYDYMPGLYLVY